MRPGEARTRRRPSCGLHRVTSTFGRTGFLRFAPTPYDLSDAATVDIRTIAEHSFDADGISPEAPTTKKNGSTRALVRESNCPADSRACCLSRMP